MSKFTIQYLLSTFFCDLKWETKVPTRDQTRGAQSDALPFQPPPSQFKSWNNKQHAPITTSLGCSPVSDLSCCRKVVSLVLWWSCFLGDPCRVLFTQYLTSRNLGQVILVALKTKMSPQTSQTLSKNITWPCFCAFLWTWFQDVIPTNPKDH